VLTALIAAPAARGADVPRRTGTAESTVLEGRFGAAGERVRLEISRVETDDVAVLRVDGCRLSCVAMRGSRHRCDPFPVHGRGAVDHGGTGALCRPTPAGTTEIVAIDHGPWSSYDAASERFVAHDRVPWRRRVFVLQGGELVPVAEEQGTTAVRDDPAIPLVNHFACGSFRHPAEPSP